MSEERNGKVRCWIRFGVYILLTLIAVGVAFGRYAQRIDSLDGRIERVERGGDDIRKFMRSINERLSRIEGKIDILMKEERR